MLTIVPELINYAKNVGRPSLYYTTYARYYDMHASSHSSFGALVI